MKILSAEQTREVDQYTIENEPVKSIDLMERAATAFTQWFTHEFDPRRSICIVCGTGNNGGDGLAIARQLLERQYSVDVTIISRSDKSSDDFKTNEQRLKKLTDPTLVGKTEDMPGVDAYDVLIDAIFGSGLSRPVEGLYAEVINAMNAAEATIVSVDIASGLFADQHTPGDCIIRPAYTLSFHMPKLAFMFPQNEVYAGEIVIRDIGLSVSGIQRQATDYCYLDKQFVSGFMIKRRKFSNKGDNGRALIMAGSYGKMGAAVLAARAAMRTGLGLLTMYIPSCGYTIMQTSVPEAMALVDEGDHFLTSYTDEEQYNALGIGPGIGKEQETMYSIMQAIQTFKKPLVIDADGLNIISQHREILELLPENSILTPHPKEFERLAGSWENDFDRLEKQKQFSREHKVIVVLKGAHTSVSTPEGEVYFNSTGNQGMATGGTGDVLTGVITSLLAQGYPAHEAATFGVYVHGYAGDLAAREIGRIGMVATDVVQQLPHAIAAMKEN